MTWIDDPELQAMFMSELEERAQRLIEGGHAMVAGGIDAEITSTMLREGHTIKGTGRVMGYDAVSMAGQQLELLWRRVQTSELEPSSEIGEAIVAVASVLVEAGSGDPEKGTPALAEAMSQLDQSLGMGSPGAKPNLRAVEPVAEPIAEPEPAVEPSPEPRVEPDLQAESVRPRIRANTLDPETKAEEDRQPEPVQRPNEMPRAPEPVPLEQDQFAHEHVRPRQERAPQPTAPPPTAPLAPSQPTAAEMPAAASITADLGGLLGAVESWASAETLPVSAGRMYRLINLAARIRIDLEDAEARMKTVRNSDDLDALELSFTAVVQAATDLEDDAMQLAAVPLGSMTNTLPQLVRFVSKKLGKEVRFEVLGDTDVVIDRQVLDKVSDPLRQLVVNAITHGIETPEVRAATGKPPTGTITLSSAIKDRRVELIVTDDGSGVDWGAVRATAIENGVLTPEASADPANLNDALFSPGFSTGSDTDLGGAGKGLSSVAEIAESLFGRVRLDSIPGGGTTVTLSVPTSRTLQRVMVFETGGMKWGIPEAVVDEVLPIDSADMDWSGDSPTLEWRGQAINVSALGDIVGATESRPPKHIIIVSHRVGMSAVTVQAVHGVREVAAKELGPLLSGPSHITGAALLGGGDVVLVLDAALLVGRSDGVAHVRPQTVHEEGDVAPVPDEARIERVLVVDDSIGARAVVSGALASSGFVTSVASSAAEALEILGMEEIDALVVDFSMPQEDGAELVARIRAQGRDMPVVMLSGVATEEDKARSKDAGVDVFFDKADFREGALAETLREMLARR